MLSEPESDQEEFLPSYELFYKMADSLYPEIRQYREEIQRKVLSEEPIKTSFGRKTFYQKKEKEL